jgi:hypothetical protein
MRYQLWDMISYGIGEPLLPFTLLKESDNFTEIYLEFNKINLSSTPCVIILSEENDSKRKIYESPDGGETIYERNVGDYKNRKKIK